MKTFSNVASYTYLQEIHRQSILSNNLRIVRSKRNDPTDEQYELKLLKRGLDI